MVPPDDTEQGQAPTPTSELYGGKAVGLGFNPSGNPQVDQLKKEAAEFIQSCWEGRETAIDPEVKRMYSVAITEAQTAQMWAVKAATWSN